VLIVPALFVMIENFGKKKEAATEVTKLEEGK
jgi:hypothetical protein